MLRQRRSYVAHMASERLRSDRTHPVFDPLIAPLGAIAAMATAALMSPLRETAFADPQSFFHRFSQMSQDEAEKFGLWAWDAINLPNLRDNIRPTMSRADLILRKGASHAIEEVRLRRV